MFRWEGKELRKQVRKVKISFYKHHTTHMASQEYHYLKQAIVLVTLQSCSQHHYCHSAPLIKLAVNILSPAKSKSTHSST